MERLSGIQVECPHCKMMIRLELYKPLRTRLVRKLIKNVEKVWRFSDIKKEKEDEM